MNKLRYPEKKYLSTYELTSTFFKTLGVKVVDIIPLRKVFVLKTDKGNKILKKVDYDGERLNFINLCVENISKKFPNIISFNTFSDGKKYKMWKGNCYVLMDLIEGREATFTNPIEFKMCGELLAKAHLASLEFAGEKNIKSKIDKSLVIKYREALKNIEEEEILVKSFRFTNEFDSLFIHESQGYIKEIKEAIKLLALSKYSDYREAGKNIVVCHNDLAEHNFLFSSNEMYLIDFDYCSIDLRIMDLADLLLNGIKNVAFDFSKALDVIDGYNKIYPLENEEYKLLYILLLFPREFCGMVTSYYHKQKSWEEEVFINRLKMKIMNEDFRREFLEKYRIKFNIS
ncbi:CotS family spore coat protein [Clostridium vincentii]|uniref:Spore coat protein S n=1 Tax=Clostridium vincentii TaxID=52704 RepID=A0A2T0BH97_9CLOT|nr:CotS family spore coat protein [Clostridium vincentii]PRR83182.1 Spore coat protein S [Clostridium vincentii]